MDEKELVENVVEDLEQSMVWEEGGAIHMEVGLY